MGTEQDLEAAEYDAQVEIKAPILQKAKSVVTDGYAVENLTGENKKGHEWIVYLTTFVTVCGSFAFGSSIDFSSPIQYTITVDLNLSLAEYSLFGSILNFGAMISAVTSGRIADFIGRKGSESKHDLKGF